MTPDEWDTLQQRIDGKTLVFFDGVCNFCNGSVNFIIDRDPRSQMMFAPLQSEAAQRILEEHSFVSDLDTIVVLDGGRLYTHSSAGIRIVRKLNGLWPLLSIGWIVPRPLRDGVYRWVAHNRYKWFGKEEVCRMPTPDIRARFVAFS